MRFRDILLVGSIFLLPSIVNPQSTGAPALAKGDLLKISVWREPDLSGEFVVDEQGVVTLPLLGKRSVLNTSVSALRDSLMAAYAVQLRNPAVTITPLRRIYVLGEVNKPGLYPVDPTISLSGAVGMAGGATELGDINRLRLVRDGKVLFRNKSVRNSLSAEDIRSDDQVFVERRGWLDRNSTFVASAAVSTVTLAISLILTRR